MFSYIRKKQQQTNDVPINKLSSRQKQSNKPNQANQVLKLPFGLLDQLVNQSMNIERQQQKHENSVQTELPQNKQQELSETEDNNSLQNSKEEVLLKNTMDLNVSKGQKEQDKKDPVTIFQTNFIRQTQSKLLQNQIQQDMPSKVAQNIDQKNPHSKQKTHALLSKTQQNSKKFTEAIKHLQLSGENSKLNSLSQRQIDHLGSMFFDVLKEILKHELVGQKTEIQSLSSDLLPKTLSTIHQLNSAYYQSFILQTKQKYNQLVDQSTNLFSKSRQIANLVNEFVMSINLFFQSEELLIPAQEIHKAITQLNPQKTEKYVNYLIKIFESNFEEVIEKRVKEMKSSLENELRRSQKQVRELQGELKRLQMSFKQKESVFSQQQAKFGEKQMQIVSLKREINELNVILNSVSSESKQKKEDYNSELLLLKRQIQRSKKQYEDSNQRINKLQKLLEKKQKLIQEKDEQIEKLGDLIRKVKQVESQGMQNLYEEMETKQKMVQDKIQKFNSQKIHLQNKIRTLVVERQIQNAKKIQIQKECQQLRNLTHQLKQEVKALKQVTIQKNMNDRQHSQKEGKGEIQQDQELDEQKQEKYNLSNFVNKQIMGHLFLSFDDESKEWAIRNNIRNQIYILLDISKGTNLTKNQNILKKIPIKSTNEEEGNISSNNVKGQSNKKATQSSIIGKWLGW